MVEKLLNFFSLSFIKVFRKTNGVNTLNNVSISVETQQYTKQKTK